MTYWLDLFTGTTWEEFRKAGAKVTGFREHQWARAQAIEPGDVFLCYLVGVKRWVGALKATSKRYKSDEKIWKEESFPVRFDVEPLVMLPPEHGVPMEQFEGKLSFFPAGGTAKQWSGFLRSSPTRYKPADGDGILQVLQDTKAKPVSRPVDKKKLLRSANLYKTKLRQGGEEIDAVVGVPVAEVDAEPDAPLQTGGPTHTEIQYRLLDLGSQMGLKVWAPKSDRGKTWNGAAVGSVPRLLGSLPTNFDDVTNSIVENIDVIWFSEENAIVAAFEVEHTTAVYSGLLRMSDLITMQPNINIRLYLVGPDERYTKFKKEIPRPTFAYRKTPLHRICGFLPYSKLCARLDLLKDMVKHVKPEFLEDVAEFYDPADELEA
ncbi:EVE domain-containing protein [Urbifossiella limnaea]|uniref:EVE domain-containing protein n=1 Tax=Urbifossiella limnaea TaxID=2528023 RepID=A0A517XLU2_9BACT|nr:hypothetical protein [Urbifossiella limnaea]QDU18475.1 hypothetical protein ETAA1_03630 [Urbifossiella limnaea]